MCMWFQVCACLTEVMMAKRVLLMVGGLFLNLGHIVSECLYVSECYLLKFKRYGMLLTLTT